MPEPNLLGEFLRARRERLQPEPFGLGRGTRRRTPGLRREEAAALCGISPTWYTWIEQGRTRALSVAALSAIASGLRLSRAERAYLYTLAARPAVPVAERDSVDPQRLDPLLAALRAPAYVLDRHWDALAWNTAAAELFGDWLGDARERRERNLLRYVFLQPAARRFIPAWPERARRLVAEYRADTASWHDDPVRRALVDELCADSAAFAAAWNAQQVQAREGGTRSFRHPRRGACVYEQLTLRVASFPELKLTVLTPVVRGRRAMAMLRV